MDWVDTILKIAGLVDAMFFLAYSIDRFIEWIISRRSK